MLYKNDIVRLDDLAEECSKAEMSSSRFLYFEYKENTAEQDKLRQGIKDHDTNVQYIDVKRI